MSTQSSYQETLEFLLNDTNQYPLEVQNWILTTFTKKYRSLIGATDAIKLLGKYPLIFKDLSYELRSNEIVATKAIIAHANNHRHLKGAIKYDDSLYTLAGEVGVEEFRDGLSEV